MIEGMPLKEEQFKVLKTLSEATNRMDITMFAKKVDLDPNQTIHQIQELTKEGFLQKVGSGYGITDKGRAVLKAFNPVPEMISFHFYQGMGQPLDLTARTLAEFYKIIKEVSVESLEFHLYRDDFENWLNQACKEPETAQEIGALKAEGLKGEDLRVQILKVLNSKYGIKEML